MIRKTTTKITPQTIIHQRQIRIIMVLEQQPVQRTKALTQPQVRQLVQQPIKVLRVEAPIRQPEQQQEVRHRQVENKEQTAV